MHPIEIAAAAVLFVSFMAKFIALPALIVGLVCWGVIGTSFLVPFGITALIATAFWALIGGLIVRSA